MIEHTSAWDELDTLVFDRNELQKALDAVRAELDRPSSPAPIAALAVKDESGTWPLALAVAIPAES